MTKSEFMDSFDLIMIYHDLTDLGSLIQIQTTSKKHILKARKKKDLSESVLKFI